MGVMLGGPGPGGSGGLCKCPGAVAGAGEPEVDEPAEVEGGGPVVEPDVVLGDAAVGDAAVGVGDEPGDGPPGRRPPPAGVCFSGGGGGGAGGGRPGSGGGGGGVEGQNAPGLGGGAALAQRAAAAARFELGCPVAIGLGAAQGDGVPGRAGDRAGLVIDGEVVEGEATGDSWPQQRRFDHRRVACGPQVLTQLAGAISGIAEDG